jgi:hypothetical protein
VYELYATLARHINKSDDKSAVADLTEEMVAFIESEITRLDSLEQRLATEDVRKVEYKWSAAVIPGPEVSDRLLRYETHLSREIDKTLNRLERLQRARRGESLPPRLEVDVS